MRVVVSKGMSGMSIGGNEDVAGDGGGSGVKKSEHKKYIGIFKKVKIVKVEKLKKEKS